MDTEYRVRCTDGRFAAVSVLNPMSTELYWTAQGNRALAAEALAKPTRVWVGEVNLVVEDYRGVRTFLTLKVHGTTPQEVRREAEMLYVGSYSAWDDDTIVEISSDDPSCPLCEPPVPLTMVDIDWGAEDEHLQAYLFGLGV